MYCLLLDNYYDFLLFSLLLKGENIKNEEEDDDKHCDKPEMTGHDGHTNKSDNGDKSVIMVIKVKILSLLSF